MDIPQTMMRGGNDPPLSWTFVDSDNQPVPLPDWFELWIQPQGSPRIEANSRPGGGLVVKDETGSVSYPMTVAEAQRVAKGTGRYELWGESSGIRRMWAGGDFIVEGVI